MNGKQRLVVIGNGMAGARLVEDVVARSGGDLFDIVIFGDEPYGNYNRILLSSVLSGTHDPKDIFINPLGWYEENNVKLHAGVRVTGIDRENRLVHGANGIDENYDYLVIATGSSPFVPPLEGLKKDDGEGFTDGVFVFRTLDDCDLITRFAEGGKRAAVIGGGLLGLEAARGLLNLGAQVHVVHLMSHLMEVQLDADAGATLKRSMEAMGVQVHLNKATTAILGNDRVRGLQFKDGSQLECEMVVISAGIRPNVALAREAGLLVERGIVVGDDLKCVNDSDIFAVGECAQHRGQVYGLVAPLWEQTAVLAERLTGHNPNAAYQGSKVSTKLKVMGIELAVMGSKEPEGTDEVVSYVETGRGIYKKLIVRDGQLAGAILLGDGTNDPLVWQAFDRGTQLPENRAALLFSLAEESGPIETASMPDSAQVCNCNGVSKGQILAAVNAGHRSLKAVCDATRAGTGCGSCKPQVQRILELACDGALVEDASVHYYVSGVALRKPELIQAIREQNLRSVSAVFNALAGGKEDPSSKVGLASLLSTIWGKDYEDERDARFINDRVHANIQKDRTFSVVPRIYGGVTSPDELRRIAHVAEKYDVKMVKITGGQRIDLLGIQKEDLPNVWRDLGMPSGHAYTKAFRTCKTCVGTDFCRYGVGDSTGLGVKIEKRFQGIESPHKMKLAAAGCPRNCSEATTKDLGAVAIEGGAWEIYIGGAAGSQVRKGDLLATVGAHDEVLKYMGRFIQYYRENAKYLERTYGFVERLGIEKLRLILVDDSEGICGRLDADIQAAVEAYVDPWQEAHEPMHPSQFVNLLTIPAEAAPGLHQIEKTFGD
ncbi:MAG TPA: nitrite reductase large subunit NirB [Blastocatellia bacterium]|jgi:nitrite reductase (NADH) large subunit|nr:nitrite reductase large subunit NirB [Blastocatellia bacterium]